jgi:hypothetical protein
MTELSFSLCLLKFICFFDSNSDAVERKATVGYEQAVGSAVPVLRSFRPAFLRGSLSKISETQVFFFF